MSFLEMTGGNWDQIQGLFFKGLLVISSTLQRNKANADWKVSLTIVVIT